MVHEVGFIFDVILEALQRALIAVQRNVTYSYYPFIYHSLIMVDIQSSSWDSRISMLDSYSSSSSYELRLREKLCVLKQVFSGWRWVVCGWHYVCERIQYKLEMCQRCMFMLKCQLCSDALVCILVNCEFVHDNEYTELKTIN